MHADNSAFSIRNVNVSLYSMGFVIDILNREPCCLFNWASCSDQSQTEPVSKLSLYYLRGQRGQLSVMAVLTITHYDSSLSIIISNTKHISRCHPLLIITVPRIAVSPKSRACLEDFGITGAPQDDVEFCDVSVTLMLQMWQCVTCHREKESHSLHLQGLVRVHKEKRVGSSWNF